MHDTRWNYKYLCIEKKNILLIPYLEKNDSINISAKIECRVKNIYFYFLFLVVFFPLRTNKIDKFSLFVKNSCDIHDVYFQLCLAFSSFTVNCLATMMVVSCELSLDLHWAVLAHNGRLPYDLSLFPSPHSDPLFAPPAMELSPGLRLMRLS